MSAGIVRIEDVINSIVVQYNQHLQLIPHWLSVGDVPRVDAVEVVRCKDCKYFELDHFDRINGIPIITAHEICTKWSGGSKTSKSGFCFLGERKNSESEVEE